MLLLLVAAPSPSTEPPIDLANKCDPAACVLPYCYCSRDGTRIPGDLDPDQVGNNSSALSSKMNRLNNYFQFQTPQMILLTFDGAINLNNFDHYKKVFTEDRINPNGCKIKGTFFLAHEYSNYHMIQTVAHEGHEIATETIS